MKVVFCNFNEPYYFLFKSVSHTLSIFNFYQYQISNKNNIIMATKFIKNYSFKHLM
ncbi:hypothetical protein PROVRETT_06907 [Providencia rettgeri DSM 1131]|nr:hypothetical protein PROVRETT_06907 [Providencia rettgeri DSM 1131]